MPLKPILRERVKGKTLILRADLNSGVRSGRIVPSARLSEHSASVKALAAKGAKVVVLSHQGRKGKDDFISLKQHAAEMQELSGMKVEFIASLEELLKRIPSMKNGEIVLFENTRFLEGEEKELSPQEHAENPFIQKLSKLADFFVLDGFSVAHRSHMSVVGFTPLLPSFIGPVFGEEFNALSKALHGEKPRVLLLGGAKTRDSLKLLKHLLGGELIDKALLGGLMGELFIKASGKELGSTEEFLKGKEFLEFLGEAKELSASFREKILLPVDVAVDRSGERRELLVEGLPSEHIIKDIGSKTVRLFSRELSSAKLIIWNGPLGVFEEKPFSLGTKKIAAVVSSSKAFSVLGGGDTETAISSMGFSKKDFSYISLSGKASLKFLSGSKLAAIEALEKGGS